MSQTDDLKGRAKQAAGDLTDNDKLRREGTADRAAGKAKEIIDEVKERAESLVDKVKDQAHRDR